MTPHAMFPLTSRQMTRALSCLTLVTGLVVATPSIGLAQSAKTLYTRAQAREATLRKTAAPSVTSLRALAASYEGVVRRYPRTSYADNALWQAALVSELAYGRSRQARDLTTTTRLLRWLTKEYPHSTLVKQAKAKIAALDTPAPTATQAGAAATATPVAVVTRPSVAPPATPAPAAAAPAIAATTSPTPTKEIGTNSVTMTALVLSNLPRGDRITIDLSKESTYTVEAQAGGRQLRLWLDASLSREAQDALGRMRGAHIQSAKAASRDAGTELMLALNGQARHSVFPLYEPYRLVIDIEVEPTPLTRPAAAAASAPTARPVAAPSGPSPAPLPVVRVAPPPVVAPVVAPLSTADAMAATPSVSLPPPPQPPASTSRGGYSLARQLGLGVSRIVIDPGHGGHDPGAKAHGLSEADVVLDVALRLEQLLLAQPGFEVVLTRRTDTFVPLEGRTAMANKETADLFLSIHANSSPRASTRGIETYFLNLANNPQAEAVAARENATSSQSMRTLPQLVRAITNNNKLAESREFAGMVQQSLMKQMRAQFGDVKDLGVKQAPFVVLIGAAMPSVLAEISFLTNRADATNLKSPAGRQRIAQALADSVLRYQASLKGVKAVAAVEPAARPRGQN